CMRCLLCVLLMLKASTNVGTELLATWRREPLTFTGVYGFVHAKEYENTAFEDVPLTPRHAVTLLGGLEDEEVGRFVVEWFYTGRQRLEANPFRSDSVPFMTIGLLVERAFGKVHLFVNGEDLNNVRQTRYDPLIARGAQMDGGRSMLGHRLMDGT